MTTNAEATPKTPEQLYAEHRRLAAELSEHQDILSPIAEARKRLGELATGSLLDRLRSRQERKSLETVISNHEQALNSGYQALDNYDIPVALADKAQEAYDANLEESRQHLAEHPEEYSAPEELSAGEKS